MSAEIIRNRVIMVGSTERGTGIEYVPASVSIEEMVDLLLTNEVAVERILRRLTAAMTRMLGSGS